MPPGLGLSLAEEQLAEGIATPLFVANSAYSPTLTQQARDKAVAAVPTVEDVFKAGQVIVDQGHLIGASDMVDDQLLRPGQVDRRLGQARGLDAARNHRCRAPAGLAVALPARVLAPQPDAGPDRPDLRTVGSGGEAARRPGLAALRDPHGRGRDAAHAAARRRRRRGHGRAPGSSGRPGQRLVGRALRVRLPRRLRRHPGHPQGRAAALLPAGGAGRRGHRPGGHRHLRAAGPARHDRHAATRGRRGRRRTDRHGDHPGHLRGARESVRDSRPARSCSSWRTRRSLCYAGCSSRRPARITTR